MIVTPVLVVALLALVPSFSEAVTVAPCELRDQLAATFGGSPENTKLLATVVCEVDQFVNRPVMPPTMTTTTTVAARRRREAGPNGGAKGPGSGPDRSEKESGPGGAGVNSNLKKCVAVVNDKATVDSVCFGTIFKDVAENASKKCKDAAPSDVFKDCAPLPQATSATKPGSGSGTKPGPGSGPGSGTGTGSGSGTKPGSGSGTGTGSGSGSKPGKEEKDS